MQTCFKIAGILLIVLSLIHIIFPKRFEWKQQLATLSLINKQMMHVHTFFIAFVVLLMGLLCLTSSNELINTTLGKRIDLGLGIFWAARLFVQFFVYSAAHWKGKAFETAVHIFFSFFWAYLSTLFLLAYFT
jgi:hypothetical protein